MALRVLGDNDPRATSTACAICVAGAGVAGLTAAVRLARLGRSVVLLESGRSGRDAAVQALSRIDGAAVNDGGPRHRGLGGNSTLWAGKLLPLSPQDMQPRPYLELEGWPLRVEDLQRYRLEIETMMGLDHESFEEDVSNQLDPFSLLPKCSDDFALRWPKIPAAADYDLARVLRRDIATLDNLIVWTDATAAGFEVDAASGRVVSLDAVSLNGRVMTVRAEQYLIAAGTLETTRLLLSLDRHMGDRVFGPGAVLGRYFNDHLGVNVAAMQPRDAAMMNKAFADRFMLGCRRHLHFELSPGLQQSERVGSGYFDIGVAQTSALAAGKRLLLGLRDRRLDIDRGDVQAVAAGIPAILRTAEWRYLRKIKYWPAGADVQIKFWIEQLPRAANRLLLSDKRDASGMPLLKIEWTSSEAEERTLEVLCSAMQRYWNHHLNEVCALAWRKDFVEFKTRRVDLTNGHAHPAGTTRMGTNPKTSVVDPDLKVHRLANLSVASASVFPTSGSANPTYSIMQVAMRAADAIADRLAPV